MKKPATGIVVLNVFICILLVLPIFLLAFFAQSRHYVTKGTTEVMNAVSDGEYDELREDMVEELFDSMGVDVDDIDDEFIDDTNDLIDNMFNDAVKYMFTREGEGMDVDAIVDYFDKHADEIEDMTDYEITDDDLDELRDILEEELDDFEDEVDDIWDEDSETSAIIKVWFGKETVIALSVIIAIGLLIIFATFNVRLDKSLKYTGVTLIVSSVFMFFGTGILAGVKEAALDDLDFEATEDFFNLIIRNGLIVDFLVFALGLILIILGSAYRKKLKNQYGDDFEPKPARVNPYTSVNTVNNVNPYANANNNVNPYANNTNPYANPYANNTVNNYGNVGTTNNAASVNTVNNAPETNNSVNTSSTSDITDSLNFGSEINTDVNTDVPTFDNNNF